MMAILDFLIGTPMACAAGYLLAKLLHLDALAKLIGAKVPLFNKLPWVKQ